MENIRFLIKNYAVSRLGIGNILKCLISSLSVNDDTVIECYPEYIYGNYDTVLDQRFISKNDCFNKEIEIVYTCRLLIHKSEEHIQNDLPSEELYMGGLTNPRFHSLFSFTKRIDWNYESSRIHITIQRRIFNTIAKIKFTPTVYNEVERNMTFFKGNHVLGMSVRTWLSSHETNVNREYNFEMYKSVMDILRGSITHIIFSIDNIEYIRLYIEYFNKYDISYTVLLKHDGINDIQFAVTKMLTLSRCQYIIGNRISTFTELIYWFGRCIPVIYPIG